jgi:hypothetical protein
MGCDMNRHQLGICSTLAVVRRVYCIFRGFLATFVFFTPPDPAVKRSIAVTLWCGTISAESAAHMPGSEFDA